MKRFFNCLGIFAAALALVSCARELDFEKAEPGTHNVTFKAEAVKTLFDGTNTIKWDGKESVVAYENGKRSNRAQLDCDEDGIIATIHANFDDAAQSSGELKYNVIVAKNVSDSKNPQLFNTQVATSTSFDPTADILVSKVETLQAEGLNKDTQLDLSFARPVAINRMRLTDFAGGAGEKIRSVEFSADVTLAGFFSVDFENGQVTQYGASGQKKNIVVTYDEENNNAVLETGDFPVYFLTFPTPDGCSNFKVVVRTDKYVYTKEVQPTSPLKFKLDTLVKFKLSLADAEKVEASTPVTYSLVSDDSGLVDGARYIIVGEKDGLYYAMGPQGANNRTAIEIPSPAGDVISLDNTYASLYKICNTVDGWTIQDVYENSGDNGKYLYSPSTSNNQIKSKGEAAFWEITIQEDGKAEVEAKVNRPFLGFNYNSGSPLFACYKDSSTSFVYLYVSKAVMAPKLTFRQTGANSVTVSWDAIEHATEYTVTCSCDSETPRQGTPEEIEGGIWCCTFDDLTLGTDYTFTVDVSAEEGWDGNSASKQFSLNVYKKVKNITDGEYIIVNGGYYLPNVKTTNACPEAKAIEITDNKVSGAISSDMIWTITTSGDDGRTLTIRNADGDYLLVSGIGTSYIRVNTSSDTWSLEDNGDGFAIKDNVNKRYCAVNTDGTTQWRSYTSKSTNYLEDGKLYFYRKTAYAPAVPLDAPVVNCTEQGDDHLTFTWGAVTGAIGYKVSTDGGKTYGETIEDTSYTWTGLESNKAGYKLFVKAVGDGEDYLDSEAASAEGTTTFTENFVFNTDAGLAALGIEKPASGYTKLGSAPYRSGENGAIDLTATDGSTATRVYNSGTATDLRIYAEGTITFSGAQIIKVAFNGSNLVNLGADSGELSKGTWTGSAPSVKFTANGSVTVNTIAVTCAGKSAATRYTVSVSQPAEGGTISAAPTSALAGTTVALTATPADEYELGSWTVTKTETQTTVDVTDNAFTMPAADVTVSASFNKKTYAITGNPAEHGTYTVKVGGKEVTAASKDDIVTLTATPALRYKLDKWTVTKTGTKTTTYTVTDNAFTMPAAAVTIDAAFSYLYNGYGTEDEPFTVNDAIALIDNEVKISDVCVTGTVSTVLSYDDHSITYRLDKNTQFEVSKGKGLGGADFNSGEDLHSGDKVVIKGTLIKSGDKYTLAPGNHIVSIEKVLYLKAKADKTSIPSDGGVVTITVDSNVDWTTAVSDNPNFEVGETEDNTVKINVAKNESGDQQSATITISAVGVEGVNPVEINLTQNAASGTGTYACTFTSKSWGTGDGEVQWTKNKDGSSMQSGKGVQITNSEKVTGAGATTTGSFTGVSKVVVKYCTNASTGKGAIKIQVGEGTEKSVTVEAPASGGTTLKNAEFTFDPKLDGTVKLTVDCTVSSIYINGVTIYAD